MNVTQALAWSFTRSSLIPHTMQSFRRRGSGRIQSRSSCKTDEFVCRTRHEALLTPSCTTSSIHLNYQSSRLQLRQLLDLAMIRARYESTIDWTELDHRFCSVGMGQVLATYLEFAKVLLGQPTPQLSHVPRAGALADFRRMMDRRPYCDTWQRLQG